MPTSLATRQTALRDALAAALPADQIHFGTSPPPAPLPALHITFLGPTTRHTIRWRITLHHSAQLPQATAATLALETREALISTFADTRYRFSEDTVEEPLEHDAVGLYTTDALTTGVTLPHPQQEHFEHAPAPAGRYLDGTPYRRLLTAPAATLHYTFNHLSAADRAAIAALPDQPEYTLRTTDGALHRAALLAHERDAATGITKLTFSVRPLPEIDP